MKIDRERERAQYILVSVIEQLPGRYDHGILFPDKKNGVYSLSCTRDQVHISSVVVVVVFFLLFKRNNEFEVFSSLRFRCCS